MKLLNGECMDIMKAMEANSVDALVTDPPAGISFMGENWDHHKGGSKHWIAWMTEVMSECLRVLKPGAHGLVWAIPRTSHWTATALENAGFEVRDVITHLFGSGFPKSLDVSKAIDKAAGVSDLAKQWIGWGTALKPAHEMWWLVRKPIGEKTIAKNVEKWGVGGINIDGTRINNGTPITKGGCTKVGGMFGSGNAVTNPDGHSLGRFPANIVLDEVGAQMLDEQTSIKETGGNSRFFYVAKASKSERGEGNNHPTVKSIKLMRYLCRLIVPPNGIVLDPFMGSGSTGIAARQEGFRFVGIEKEPDYFSIAEKRTAKCLAF